MRPSVFNDDDDDGGGGPLPSAHHRALGRPVPAALLDPAAALQLQAAGAAGLLDDFDAFLEAKESSSSSSSSSAAAAAAAAAEPLPSARLPQQPRGPAPPQASHYIAAMVQKAEEKKRIQDAVLERRLAKEQAAEEALYGVKERFVTAGYAAQQEARQREAAAGAQQAAQEEAALAGRRSLGGLYRSVLFGGEGGAGAAAAAAAAAAGAPAPSAAKGAMGLPVAATAAAGHGSSSSGGSSGSSSSSSAPPSSRFQAHGQPAQASAAAPPAAAAEQAAAAPAAAPAPLGFTGSTPEEIELARVQALARFEARKAAGLL